MQRQLSTPLAELPLFRPGSQPVYALGNEQAAALRQLFEKMLAELHADYALKYDLLRAHVLKLLQSALKLQPAAALHHGSTATARIAALFAELPGQRVHLRSAEAFAGQLAAHVNHLNRFAASTTTVL